MCCRLELVVRCLVPQVILAVQSCGRPLGLGSDSRWTRISGSLTVISRGSPTGGPRMSRVSSVVLARVVRGLRGQVGPKLGKLLSLLFQIPQSMGCVWINVLVLRQFLKRLPC